MHLPVKQFMSGGIKFTSPKSIPGMALWYDGSDGATVIQSAGLISQWRDKSNNANHANQAVAANQAGVITAGQNGLNTVRCTFRTGPTDSSFMNLTSVVDFGATGYSFAGVVRRGGPAGSNVIETLGATAQDFAGSIEWYSDLTVIAYGPTGFNLTPGIAATDYNAISATVATNDICSVRFNGVLQSTSFGADPVSRIAPFDRLMRADSLFCNGEIAELIFYFGVISAQAISWLNSYLKQKWGTP